MRNKVLKKKDIQRAITRTEEAGGEIHLYHPFAKVTVDFRLVSMRRSESF